MPKTDPGSHPQNERENTSYDVATLQDEEGELPDFPGEPPARSSFQAPLPMWSLEPQGVKASVASMEGA